MAATAPGATIADIANNPIDFVSGDNTATNPKLARFSGTKFNGCDEHKLNLEVNNFISKIPSPPNKRQREDRDDEDSDEEEIIAIPWRQLVTKIDKSMVALSSLKNSSILRRAKASRAKQINGVRWSATTQTMVREQKLRPHLIPTDFPRDMRGLFLTPVEQADADDLVLDLKCFEKVNKALQGQGKTKETPRLTVPKRGRLWTDLFRDIHSITLLKLIWTVLLSLIQLEKRQL